MIADGDSYSTDGDDAGAIHDAEPFAPSRARRAATTLTIMAPLVHVALAQLKPRKGDYPAISSGCGALFAQLDALDAAADGACVCPRPR